MLLHCTSVEQTKGSIHELKVFFEIVDLMNCCTEVEL